DDDATVMHPSHRAVRSDDPVFGIERRRLSRKPAFKSFMHFRLILTVNGILPDSRVFINFRHRDSPSVLKRRTDIKDALGFEFHEPKHLIRALRETAEAFFALEQGLFGASALGNVSREAQIECPTAKVEGAHPDLHRECRAILAPMPAFQADRFPRNNL